MKKILLASALAFAFMMGTAATADAKCYKFSGTPSGVYVCVGKNGADSFSDRKKAKKVLKKAGYSPSSVSSTSSSCHSNQNKCYDANGKAHRSLKGY